MKNVGDLYYLVAIATVLVGVASGWASGRLFKTKTIKDIVRTANDTINLYEARENALEGKIDELTSKVTILQTSLEKALAQNELLQNMLLKTGVVNVTVPLGNAVHGPDTPQAA